MKFAITFDDNIWELAELDTGVESEGRDGFWNGYITFISYSEITNNRLFASALEHMVNGFFAQRIIGGHTPKLKGIDIRRRLTADERTAYGNDARAVVTVKYQTVRDIVHNGTIVSYRDGIEVYTIKREHVDS